MDDDTTLTTSVDSQSSGAITLNLTGKSQGPSKGNKERLCISKIITTVIFFLAILITTLATILAESLLMKKYQKNYTVYLVTQLVDNVPRSPYLPVDWWQFMEHYLDVDYLALNHILLLEKHKSSTERMSCLDGWIGYLGKCFYFSENTRTWAASQNFCASHAATLAVFNTTKDNWISRNDILTILNIGLSREPGQTWKWIDGTIYSGWFKIIGIGECAYLHKIGISSASTHLVRKWICSKPDTCIPRS